MNESEWLKQYLADFPPPDRLLHDLAREYHERCEAYDRTVCSGPIGPEGGILPMNPHERGLISRHAIYVRNELIFKAEQQGRTSKALIRAIQDYDRV